MKISYVLIPVLQMLHGVSSSSITDKELIHRGEKTTYILRFENAADTPDSVYQNLIVNLKTLGAKVNYEYHNVIKGVSVTLDSSLLNNLKGLNNDAYPFIIEQDKGVHTY